ncbi:MAG TPA: hypothetical protein VHC71_11310 [Hyphomicrobium sp.]|nr:hypothetical protein [Hyphomicrobium sp.]
MRFVGLLILLAGLSSTVPSSAEQVSSRSTLTGRYFLVVWGLQGPDNDVVDSHTFVSFYRGDELDKGIVKPATISWLPATGVVQLFGSEKGRNFTLAQTLRMACQSGRQLKSWGPYEIEPALFQRALRRIRHLQSGHIQYSMIDTDPGTMNCIDAAGDLTPIPFDSGIAWGFVASDAVVQHLSPYFKQSRTTDLPLKRLLTRNACQPSTAASH